jgi:hypothetical protein
MSELGIGKRAVPRPCPFFSSIIRRGRFGAGISLWLPMQKWLFQAYLLFCLFASKGSQVSQVEMPIYGKNVVRWSPSNKPNFSL